MITKASERGNVVSAEDIDNLIIFYYQRIHIVIEQTRINCTTIVTRFIEIFPRTTHSAQIFDILCLQSIFPENLSMPVILAIFTNLLYESLAKIVLTPNFCIETEQQ